MHLSRRGLIYGVASLLAAPAIVRASSLMPVKALPAEALPGEYYLRYREELIRAFTETLRPRVAHDFFAYGNATTFVTDQDALDLHDKVLARLGPSPPQPRRGWRGSPW